MHIPLDIFYKGLHRIMILTCKVPFILRYIYHILKIVKYEMHASYGSM